MALLITGPFTPTGYESWRAFHGTHIELMKSLTMRSDRIFRDTQDPSRIVVMQEVEDVAAFFAGLSSPETQAKLASSPIVGEAPFVILEEVEEVF
jgi:hypothetical protein